MFWEACASFEFFDYFFLNYHIAHDVSGIICSLLIEFKTIIITWKS